MLLNEKIEENSSINFDFLSNFKIKISDFFDPENFFITTGKISLIYKNKNWYLNSKKLKIKEIKIEIQGEDAFLNWRKNAYSGEFLILNNENKNLLLINKINLEDYVCFVLAKEVFGIWPKESHKVSAVITRTYALHKMIESRIRNRLYDIKSTNHDQTYLGIFWHKKIKDAVDETKNEIITYFSKPIIAMYDICCGGVVPAEFSGFDFLKYPYLKRRKICNFCKNYKDYEWKINFNEDQFLKELSNFYKKNIIKIINVKKINYRKSKSLKDVDLEILLRNKKGKKYKENLKINSKEFKEIFLKNKKSSYFSIKWNKNSLSILGKGKGHLMGLCQIGAKNMIDLGFNYKEVINFYYPDIITEKIFFYIK